jgi:HlyD family secretion protein
MKIGIQTSRGPSDPRWQVVRGFVLKTLPLYLLLLAVAFVTGGFTFLRFRSNSSASPGSATADGGGAQAGSTANPPAAPQKGAVTALGRIEPSSRVIGVGGISGDRLESLLVCESQPVVKETELAYLKSHAERFAEHGQIEASLREARKQLQAETDFGNALIHEAEFRVEQSKKLHPLKVASQEARVRAFQAELASARKDLDRATSLRKDGTITEAEWDSQNLLVRQREEALKSGQTSLEEMRAEQTLDLQLANAELERSKAALARSLALVTIESLEKRREQAKARLDQSVIRAPISGRILKILTWPGEPITQEPILQMGNTAVMHAVAEVYETDIGGVKINQKATITSPALTQPLTGRVVEIGTLIYKNDVLDIDPAADADARVVEVRIVLDDPLLAENLTNLQVSVRIETPKPTAGNAGKTASGAGKPVLGAGNSPSGAEKPVHGAGKSDR